MDEVSGILLGVWEDGSVEVIDDYQSAIDKLVQFDEEGLRVIFINGVEITLEDDDESSDPA